MSDKYIFGIDVGGTAVKIGLFCGSGAQSGKTILQCSIPTRTENAGAAVLPDIAQALNGLLSEAGASFADVTGIGIAVPGPVLEGHIVNRCVNLGWGVVDVADELYKLTGVKNVKAANDANAAALGEHLAGAAAGVREAVMLTLGTAVGGALIHNGKIVEGAFGAAGEVGHMIMDLNESVPCSCGGRGHLEQYASGRGVVYVAKKILEESAGPSQLRGCENITPKDVFDCAKAGDALALRAADTACEMLGRACAYISCVFDPEMFVIGGGVSAAGEILTEGIRKYFKQYAFHASADARFVPAKLGNDAGIYGAAGLIDNV